MNFHQILSGQICHPIEGNTELEAMDWLSYRDLQGVKSVNGKVTTDFMSPIMDFDDTFFLQIPSREDWECIKVLYAESIEIFTDGSKMEIGTGAGFYCNSLQTEQSFRLPNECSIFQAEIYAIQKALEHINNIQTPSRGLTKFLVRQL